MINRKNSPRIAAVKYLLVVPVLTAVLLVLQMSGLQAAEEYLSEKGSMVQETSVWEEALPATGDDVSNHLTEATVKKETVVIKGVVIIPDVSIEQYQDSGKLITTSLLGLREGSKPLIILNGKIISDEELQKIDPKLVWSISILKSANAVDLYGEKAADGVILITVKTEKELQIQQELLKPETIPDYRTRQGTTHEVKQSNSFRVSGTVVDATDGQPFPGVNVRVWGEANGVVTDMDGKYSLEVPDKYPAHYYFLHFSYSFMEPQQIAINNQHVINVKMMNASFPQTENETIFIFRSNDYGAPLAGRPLIIVDGKEEFGTFEITAKSIESITVFKSQKAIDLYGEKGKYGVAIVTTKK